MPQKSALYAVARIRCHERDLIGRDRMARLADSSLQDAMRQLTDMGYGHMPDADASQIEQMISARIYETHQLIKEITPDEELTDLFLYKGDIHDLKILLKLRLTGSSFEPELTEGVLDVDTLRYMVANGEYSALPAELKDAMNDLERSFAVKVDPLRISTAIDSAYIRMGYASKSEFAREYFAAMADMTNISTLLRMRGMGLGSDALLPALLPEGAIKHEKLVAAYDLPLEALGKALGAGSIRDAVIKGMDAVIKSGGNPAAFEKYRDDYLMSLARKGKYDNDTIAPVVGYMLAVEQEAVCVRMIITAKRNGLDDAIIIERLRELYE